MLVQVRFSLDLNASTSPYRWCALLTAVLAFAAPWSARAQVGITSITTSTTSGTATSTNGVTFDNTDTSITNFTDSNGSTYSVHGLATSAYVRRDTTNVNTSTSAVNPNNFSVW